MNLEKTIENLKQTLFDILTLENMSQVKLSSLLTLAAIAQELSEAGIKEVKLPHDYFANFTEAQLGALAATASVGLAFMNQDKLQ